MAGESRRRRVALLSRAIVLTAGVLLFARPRTTRSVESTVPPDSSFAPSLQGRTVATAARPAQLWTTMAPAARHAGRLRVVLYHDMEGLTGQTDWRTATCEYPKRYAERAMTVGRGR